MTPLDFMLVADRLVAMRSEGAQRSAVSRAYYAAFHAARELLEACGVRFPRIAAAHEHVHYCLDECGDAEIIRAGRTLRSLRTARNEADYDFAKRQFNDPLVVKLHLEEARQLLSTCAIDKAQAIAPAVRDYAANTLGLHVA